MLPKHLWDLACFKSCVRLCVLPNQVWDLACSEVVCGAWHAPKLYIGHDVFPSCVWDLACSKIVCGTWCIPKLYVGPGGLQNK